MLNTFEETFEVTEMRTFKHEPFFIVGGGGGGLIRGTLRYISYTFNLIAVSKTLAALIAVLCIMWHAYVSSIDKN